jgi:hypothetical protein
MKSTRSSFLFSMYFPPLWFLNGGKVVWSLKYFRALITYPWPASNSVQAAFLVAFKSSLIDSLLASKNLSFINLPKFFYRHAAFIFKLTFICMILLSSWLFTFLSFSSSANVESLWSMNSFNCYLWVSTLPILFCLNIFIFSNCVCFALFSKSIAYTLSS